MFTIIGGDGREYGPASVEQIQSWISGGRANLETQAKAVGSEDWRRLGDFPEFNPTVSAAMPPPIGAVEVAEPSAELADPGIRLLACLLDSVFGAIAAAPGAFMIGVSVLSRLILHPGEVPTDLSPRMAAGALVLAFGALLLFVIQVWMLTTRGQTLGKRVFGIRIVNHENDGNPGFLRAVLLRWFVPGLITSFIPVVGFLFFVTDSCFIFRADRRCIHDLMASTRVVKV